MSTNTYTPGKSDFRTGRTVFVWLLTLMIATFDVGPCIRSRDFGSETGTTIEGCKELP